MGKKTSKKDISKVSASKSEAQKETTDSQEVSIEKELQQKVDEINDKYLRLYSEFDNYRKRTSREKLELSKTASEEVIIELLPVLDDFERAMQSMDKTKEIKAVKEGVELIYNKFKEFLKTKGIKEIETKNKEFNTDIHEAITKFPVKDKKMKGKIVDVIEKGYYLNDKVVRFSKVVVGE